MFHHDKAHEVASMKDLTSITCHSELDLTGLNCPLPILKTKAALTTLGHGEVLKVTFTNPESLREMRIFADQSGSTLREFRTDEGSYILFFKKR